MTRTLSALAIASLMTLGLSAQGMKHVDLKDAKGASVGMAMISATKDGKITAAQVAEMVFHAMRHDQFYIYSHPKALGNAQSRFDAIVAGTNPPDPFAERPEIGEGLRQALRAG